MLNATIGYELDLLSIPYQCLQPNELTFGEVELATLKINAEIDKMEQKGGIRIADQNSPGFYSQLFVVPKRMGATG